MIAISATTTATTAPAARWAGLLAALSALLVIGACAGPRAVPPSTADGAGAGSADADADWSLAAALQLQSAFARIAARVGPSVVSVSAWERAAGDETSPAGEAGGGARWSEPHADDGGPYPGFRRVRSASGFVVSADGYILTVRHAIFAPQSDAEPDLVDVELHTNRHLRARLVAAEPTLDLAVLKVEPLRPLRPVAIGNSDAVEVGHWAIALGDPEGSESSFAPGTVAGLPRRECYQEELSATLFQTSIALHPESYGGPVVNIQGEVIGISRPRAARVPPPAALASLTPRVGDHALPIKLAMTIYEPLVVLESRRSPWLGFSILPLDGALRRRLELTRIVGVYIDDVFQPSPAQAIGVQVGDILTRLDGVRVTSVPDFQRKLYLAGIGRRIELEIYRDGERFTREVVVAERPAEAAPK